MKFDQLETIKFTSSKTRQNWREMYRNIPRNIPGTMYAANRRESYGSCESPELQPNEPIVHLLLCQMIRTTEEMHDNPCNGQTRILSLLNDRQLRLRY